MNEAVRMNSRDRAELPNFRPTLRPQQRLHDMPVHIGQTEIAALVAEGQPLVIEAEQVAARTLLSAGGP
jgi:hypothetical protein